MSYSSTSSSLKVRIIGQIIQSSYSLGPLGNKLRQQLYRFVFAEVGDRVNIQAFTEFSGTESIALGRGVFIGRDATLRANRPNCSIKLGESVRLDRGVDIRVTNRSGCHIEIDDYTSLGPYVCIAGPGRITIGRNCLIASHVGIYANNHNFADPTRCIKDQGITRKGIVIEDDCWLGTGVKVLDGVTIGHGSVIGAGAVVTKDIPPFSVAVGVPAKVISKRQGVVDKVMAVPQQG